MNDGMSESEKAMLAATVGCSVRTVQRWLEKPDSVLPAVRWALERAWEDICGREKHG